MSDEQTAGTETAATGTESLDDIVDVHPTVATLLKDFEKATDGVRMSDERLAHWEAEIAKVKPAEREVVIHHLVATGVKFKRLAPDASKPAIEQLALLTQVLTDAQAEDVAKVATGSEIAFDAAGDPARAAAGRALGADTTLRAPKVGEERPKSDFVIPRRLR